MSIQIDDGLPFAVIDNFLNASALESIHNSITAIKFVPQNSKLSIDYSQF